MADEDPYVTAQRKWAAARLGRPPEEIISVNFEYEEGFWYSDVTYQGGRFVAVVETTSGTADIEDEPNTIIRECMQHM